MESTDSNEICRFRFWNPTISDLEFIESMDFNGNLQNLWISCETCIQEVLGLASSKSFKQNNLNTLCTYTWRPALISIVGL